MYEYVSNEAVIYLTYMQYNYFIDLYETPLLLTGVMFVKGTVWEIYN